MTTQSTQQGTCNFYFSTKEITMKGYYLALLILITNTLFAHEAIKGKIVSSSTGDPISFASITNSNTAHTVSSDENGIFLIQGSPQDTIIIRGFGYKSMETLFDSIVKNPEIKLEIDAFLLHEVRISHVDHTTLGTQKLDKLNVKLMPVTNAQELLRNVSGLFIAQHAGGGKAEQIFLRGFDNDHGTDFAVFVDEIPVNLSNHAHGQGYADMHFIIPELIKDANFYKGPHDIINGNFAVSGAARYQTISHLDKNSIKLDLGGYGYKRGLIQLNLTPNNNLFGKKNNESAIFALEGTENKGYFESSQEFTKINSFLKYSRNIGNTNLSLMGSTFSSNWYASGQIPLRAVNNETITRFGAIDDSEGGYTARNNLSVKTTSYLKNDGKWSNFAYYSRNEYQLYSNFTFYLNDPIYGDMIEQSEIRDLMGFSTTYEQSNNIGKTKITSNVALGLRADFVHILRYSAFKRDRLEILNDDKVQELNSWAYIKETWKLSNKWIWQFGTRIDHFNFSIANQLNNEEDSQSALRLSPKTSIYYNLKKNVQLYYKISSGFHSNYAHSAIHDKSTSPLPAAYGMDLGTEFKVKEKLISNITVWGLQSEAEYVFIPDGGEFENKGDALHYGVDLSTKYQPIKQVWFDLSCNYSIGTLLDEAEGQNSIPSAPRFTSTSSIIYQLTTGLDIMLSYRYMAERPLTEDESVLAEAYFLLDASINYTRNNFQFGVTAQNLMNQEWQEAVFYDESRLRTEASGVMDHHFTPGTPIFIKTSVTYSF